MAGERQPSAYMTRREAIRGGYSVLAGGVAVGLIGGIDTYSTQRKLSRQEAAAREEVVKKGILPADQRALDAANKLRDEIKDHPLADRCQIEDQEKMRQAKAAFTQRDKFMWEVDKLAGETRTKEGPSNLRIAADFIADALGVSAVLSGLFTRVPTED